MAEPADNYEQLYREKLWALLPAVYRAEDSTTLEHKGPLRELVERIGVQGAVLRRSLDRLWQDQSIESCDDWVVAYLGELLATNLVSSLDARGQRLDVAKTIYYRRRKGTVPLLEELAGDITGWEARVVESFRRLGRHRHLLDPELGWPASSPDPEGARRLARAQGLRGARTGSPAGGFADLRSPLGAARAHTAFDEYAHTADVRRGRGATGWYGIPRLACFLWRLRSFPVDQATPVADVACPGQVTFDPTGRDVPLFARAARPLGDAWVSPAEHQLPGPIDARLLAAELAELYAAVDPLAPAAIDPRALGIFRAHPAGTDLVARTRVSARPGVAGTDYVVDPARGRLYLRGSAPGEGGQLRLSYHHGFSANLGAGSYDRRRADDPPAPTPIQLVSGGGNALDTALASLGPTGSLHLGDFLTYGKVRDLTGIVDVRLGAANHRRPLVRLPKVNTGWSFTGATSGARLRLDGLFLSGGDLVLRGEFDEVVLSGCSLDPGDRVGTALGKAADGRVLVPSKLRIAGKVRRLLVERSISGPIVSEGSGLVETLEVRDSIVQSFAPTLALDLGQGEATIERTTVLGPSHLHRLWASDAIFADSVVVDDTQRGCLRFSAWTTGSTLPRKYRAVELAPARALFVSRRFAQPGYAQLRASADDTIAEGGSEGAEMGAFAGERNAQKQRSLLVKLREYMPVGLEPVLIHVT